MLKQVSVYLLTLLVCAGSSLYAIEDCQRKLIKILQVGSPDSTNRVYKSANPNIQNRLDGNLDVLKSLYHPNLRANVIDRGPIEFSVIGTGEFKKMQDATSGKGFWVVYAPAGMENRNPVGHTGTVSGNTYFTGQYAMGSLGNVGARLDSSSYAAAQFFELSDQGAKDLEKFFHDRSWFYHQGNPDYASAYVVLPFSRDAHVPNGDNCVSCAYSFLDPKWIAKRPELGKLTDEMGELTVSEVPNKMVYLNTKSPAYRGTVLVTHNPPEALHWITQGDFNSHHEGSQLLFDGKPVFIR